VTEWVRIRLPNAEVTVSRGYAESLGDAVEVIDAPATNVRGTPLAATRRNGRPNKPRTTVSKEAAKKAVRKQAASSPASDNPVGVADTTPEEAS